ncbi:DUF3810 domain-containing protein [Clostridium oryzae]|uniref:DUF3810 domain-containing protein n=1 Tax=Clostridium oryzae TaxID=1450648 RepID=A0A1V4IKC2_9CLOT|nr:DUF3810 domain-containing protein [Clostridium oryzae]OPJ60488.1 hypothetical protein CLORY_27970 [Clostridium oryzae]
MSKSLKTKLIIILLTPITILINNVLKRYPQAVEKFYSNSIDRIIRQILSTITGPFLFSVAEILVITLSIILLFMIIITVMATVKGGIIKKLINLLAYTSALYVLFMICWGFNYDRIGFDKIAGLHVQKSSERQLEELCSALIYKANSLRTQVGENSKGVMYIKGGYKAAFKAAPLGYKELSKTYSDLGGKYGKPKPIMLSKYMSYSGITGIYIPYTGEANVNVNNTDLMLPCTVLHEMAHQRGFAPEDEANYIAYLACMRHPYKYFQYSGTMLALEYSMDALYDKDAAAYKKLVNLYSPAVERDLKYENEFWNKYNGKVQDTCNQVNNTYLKSNGQTDGVESYGRMVDLLLAQYRKNPQDFK